MGSSRRELRDIFVIMPFVQVAGGERDKPRLTAFFENHIKKPIEESDELEDQYYVYRSGETFDITAQIIRDLCQADIVLADLSGVEPNPNVMYELGVRLAVSERPVILIKEKMEESKTNPFDVIGYYTHSYDPYDYGALQEHIIGKLRRLETGEESFSNPVLRLVQEQFAILAPDYSAVSPARQRELVAEGMAQVAELVRMAYGPHGRGRRITGPGRGAVQARRGHRIAESVHLDNALQQEGAQLLADLGKDLLHEVGDGSKLGIILAEALTHDAIEAVRDGVPSAEYLTALEVACERAVELLREMDTASATENLTRVASTAAKDDELGADVASAVSEAGSDGFVAVEVGTEVETRVVLREHYYFDRGAVEPTFLEEHEGLLTTLKNCRVLLYTGALSSMKELLPVLERVAEEQSGLLLVAKDVTGEALATLKVNWLRNSVRCIPVKAPGRSDEPLSQLDDLAALTGTKVIGADRGLKLENVVLGDLGHAEAVTVTRHSTEIQQESRSNNVMSDHIGRLKALMSDAESDFHREKLAERIALLRGKHVTIQVGGQTPQSRDHARSAVEEALAACNAANKMGVVPGGGAALYQVAEDLMSASGDGLEQRVRNSVARALESPMRLLVESSGEDPDEVLAAPILRPYNVRTGEFEREGQVSLVDPLLVLVKGVQLARGATHVFIETGSWAGAADVSP